MSSLSAKEEARVAIILECINPGSVFHTTPSGKLEYLGIQENSINRISGGRVDHDTVLKRYIILRNAICQAISDEVKRDAIKKINKSYMVGGLNYFMVRNTAESIHKNEPSRITKDKVAIDDLQNLKLPDLIECTFCGKDDIKFGATICAGCSAIIEYKNIYENGGLGRFLFFGTSIGLSLILIIIATIFKGSALEFSEDFFKISLFFIWIGSFLFAMYVKHQVGSRRIEKQWTFKRPSNVSVGIIID